MLPLHLAGLLEAGLTVTIRSDSSKVTAIYRSPSLAALAHVQQAIGGIVHPHRKGRPFLVLNATSVYHLAETLLPLQTPWARRYTSLLALRDHKATYDSTLVRDPAYRATYAAQLDTLITSYRDTLLGARLTSESYLAGTKAAKVVNQDAAIKATLTWKQDGDSIAKAHRQRKAAEVEARLTAREQVRREREEGRRAASTQRQAEREAQWAANRAERESKRAAAKQAREQAEATSRAKVLSDIANGVRECGHCRQIKPLDQFHLHKRSIGGYKPYCKQCVHEHYVKPNRVRDAQRCRAWQAANPETLRECQRRQNHKPAHRLRNHIRTRIKAAIDRPLGTNTHISYLGCSIPDLRAYIETLWLPGMTWDTYGSGANHWCIDHIVPHVAFDHQNDQHLHWCWHYRNLRPLWVRENAVKSDLVGGTSVRQYRASGRHAELHTLVAAELERLGITTKDVYLATVTSPSESPSIPSAHRYA